MTVEERISRLEGKVNTLLLLMPCLIAANVAVLSVMILKM